jgi:NADP-dependent 3-hydroxy acid dehydrogenase YdfG
MHHDARRFRGIGRATVVRLADAGHVVFAADRRAGDLGALAAEHPGVRPVVLDVTEAASIRPSRPALEHDTDLGCEIA